MTKVYAEKDGNRFLIDAKGHAGDIEACNYITGALYSLAGYVHNAERAGFGTVLTYRTEKTGGNMTLHCTGDQRVEAAFDAAIIGLKQLEQARPNAVTVELRTE